MICMKCTHYQKYAVFCSSAGSSLLIPTVMMFAFFSLAALSCSAVPKVSIVRIVATIHLLTDVAKIMNGNYPSKLYYKAFNDKIPQIFDLISRQSWQIYNLHCDHNIISFITDPIYLPACMRHFFHRRQQRKKTCTYFTNLTFLMFG